MLAKGDRKEKTANTVLGSAGEGYQRGRTLVEWVSHPGKKGVEVESRAEEAPTATSTNSSAACTTAAHSSLSHWTTASCSK